MPNVVDGRTGDADGRFEIDSSTGEITVAARFDGVESMMRRVKITADTPASELPALNISVP